MATPPARQANTFIMKAIRVGSTSNMLEITAPIIWNKGAPGGCPTSSLTAVAVYSGQSHSGAVGSVVRMYTSEPMANISHPASMLMFFWERAGNFIGVCGEVCRCVCLVCFSSAKIGKILRFVV